MPKYIERDAFIEWLKKIPMVDLSDGRGLCRVIMEDDFAHSLRFVPSVLQMVDGVYDIRADSCYSGECKRLGQEG